MVKTYNFIVYHKKCLDGFAGFILLHKSGLIDKNAIIFPDVPNARTIPDNIENKNVIIIDVAYSYDILKQIVDVANHITFIDHHITIRDDVKKIKRETNKNITIIYDEHKSGATLVYDFLFHRKYPKFIEFIEDNDIGRWKLKDVNEFITGLRVLYSTDLNSYNIKHWYNLFKKSEIKNLINRGKIYNEYKDYLTGEHSRRFSLELFPSELIYKKFTDYFKKPGQYIVALYNGSPCPTINDISADIFKKYDCDFFVAWVLNLDRKEYVLTFRSKEVDVGSIAKLFNGGGHTLAAAGSFKISEYDIRDLFFSNSLIRK
jgi:oligoribonuclease NrnB/cAMP/cGMP phosphodiesterase (DHH superfamily)